MRCLAHGPAAGLIALCAIAFWPAQAEAGGLKALSAGMDRINAGLCRTFKASACRSHHAASKPRKARARPAAAAPPAAEAKAAVIPIPRAKPEALRHTPEATTTALIVPVPRRKPAAPGPAATPAPPVEMAPPPDTPSRAGDCLASLATLKADYALAATPADASSCQVDGALHLKSVATAHGRVRFPEQPLLDCRFAAQFARWVAEQGAVLAAAAGPPLAQIWTGPGYQCRGRNGDASAKVSEHGHGNAVDIDSLATADGQRLKVADVLDPAAASAPLLQALRHSACGYFTTVLGPGSNAAHAGHFHFDLGQHGTTGTYRICQ